MASKAILFVWINVLLYIIQQQNHSITPDYFQSVVDSSPVQNRHVFSIWSVHITATFDKFYASFQCTVLSRTDNVKILVIFWQILLLFILLLWGHCSRCWWLKWIRFIVFMLQTVWTTSVTLHITNNVGKFILFISFHFCTTCNIYLAKYERVWCQVKAPYKLSYYYFCIIAFGSGRATCIS